MKTVGFSLDQETDLGIAALAKQSKMSRSDVVRSMLQYLLPHISEV